MFDRPRRLGMCSGDRKRGIEYACLPTLRACMAMFERSSNKSKTRPHPRRAKGSWPRWGPGFGVLPLSYRYAIALLIAFHQVPSLLASSHCMYGCMVMGMGMGVSMGMGRGMLRLASG